MSQIPRTPVSGKKVYLRGEKHGIRVPVREIALASPEPPVRLYDTSGPYTDPDQELDIRAGLPRLREEWIAHREGGGEGSQSQAGSGGHPDALRPKR